MVTVSDFGNYETAWCPGCGNFPILDAVKQALVLCDLAPNGVLFVSGIGQAAKAPHYLNANVFNGLHGRAIPVATGAKIVNPNLAVIAESGDGCMYGEGGNHFLAAIRRNPDITVLVHDNRVYGLTKGQASPTSPDGLVTKAQPHGSLSSSFNPVALAVLMGAGFVARGYAGMKEHLAGIIAEAIRHKGFSLVDILQPCVSFNKVNTYAWYQERCRVLPVDYDPADKDLALRTAMTFGDEIPIGVISRRTDRPPLEERLPALASGPIVGRPLDREALHEVYESYL